MTAKAGRVTATVPVTARRWYWVFFFPSPGQTTLPTLRYWRDLEQEREQELETKKLDWTGLDPDWSGLDGTAQERTTHSTRQVLTGQGQVRTGRGTNELGFWQVWLWILRAVDPGEMEEGNAEIEGQAKT